MKQYLFIYGTLMPELAPLEIAETVKKLKFIGEGFVYGKLYDLGEYPAAILSGSKKIFGRVYELPNDSETLQKLDEYEGFYPNRSKGSLYLRKKTTVYFPEKKIQSWIYEYNQDVNLKPIIESGSYATLQAV